MVLKNTDNHINECLMIRVMAWITLEQIVQKYGSYSVLMTPLVTEEYNKNKNKKVRFYTPKDVKGRGLELRSKGEKAIFDYLNERKECYSYEPLYLIKEKNEYEQDTYHLRWPDFFIHSLNLVIEFDGTPSSKERYERRNKFYDLNGVNYLVIKPEQIKSGEYEKILDERLEFERMVKENQKETALKNEEIAKFFTSQSCETKLCPSSFVVEQKAPLPIENVQVKTSQGCLLGLAKIVAGALLLRPFAEIYYAVHHIFANYYQK